MSDYFIRDILNNISKGNLRIPSFQRGFVWDSDSVAFLMDSIYKQYPFGTIQLWRTKEKLDSEKNFGPFELFDRDEDYPIDYVLDGQQRITSIFGVFQSEIVENGQIENPFNIYYDFMAPENTQDSQFVSFEKDEKIDFERYFPLNVLFDITKYRKATESLDEKIITKIDTLQTIFREARIPFQRLETDERSKVAIVFERINRRGVPLDTLQLLTAWTWSEDFDLKNKFKELSEDLQPFGFSDLALDNDLLLKIASAVLTYDVNASSLISLNGGEVRNRFDEITNGIKGTIDFLKSNFKVEKLSNLPYEGLIIPLTVFFANKGNMHFNYTAEQGRVIKKWFWRVCFARRYSSGTNNNLNKDIQEIIQLKNNQNSSLADISLNTSNFFFLKDKFGMGSVNSKSFILLLVNKGPLNLLSANPIDLSPVLKEYNRNEFHHLYPKGMEKGDTKYDVNCLANICILGRSDNKLISNKPPSECGRDMPIDSSEVFESNFIEGDVFITDNFDDFVESRSKLLFEYLSLLIKL